MMMQISMLLLVLLLASACGAAPAAGAERVLYALDSVPGEMVHHNTDAVIVSSARGKALEVKFHKAGWPNVYFAPAKGVWDWSSSSGFAIDIYNPEGRSNLVHVRIDNAGADGLNNCINGQATAIPKQWTTLKVSFNTGAPVLWGMRGLPGTGPIGWGKKLDFSKITAFQVFLDHPEETRTLILSRPRLIGDGRADGSDVLLPFVDKFGQYKQASWPGKLGSESEFAPRLRAEQADLKSHPAPADRDGFGGYSKGPKLKSTGWFRTEKIDGKWWLVTPEGRPFFSAGIDCVGAWDTTFVEKRDKWFDWILTREDDRFGGLLSQASGAHSMAETIGGKGSTFSFLMANLIRKYGKDWQAKARESAYARLTSWGFNTIGNWSPGVLLDDSPIPFVASVHIDSSFRRIEGGGGYWGKMMDVYDDKFPEYAEKVIAPMTGRYAAKRNLIGYFVDNELSWDSVEWATLASPVDQPCRVALMEQLRNKYGTIEALNKAWGTSAKDWESLRAPEKPNAHSQSDLGAFVHAFARRYFETVKRIIRKHDSHHLYLGCRFSGHAPRAVARACADVADVVSYNIYRHTIDPDMFSGENDMGKPVIIGEFHFGAMDRGMFHPGLVGAGSQEGRAECFVRYVQSALDCPAIVGCHWFQYTDQPITGRWFDGENYNIGFVDVTDTPYPEMVDAARKVNAEIYSRRFTKTSGAKEPGAPATKLSMASSTGGGPMPSSSVKIEKVKYPKFGECYKLSNGTVDVLITLDLGPRVIFYGFSGGENCLAELDANAKVPTEFGEWHPWGGHRLWHAPEVLPRSYVPDNGPVESEVIGKSTVRVAPAFEKETGIQKHIHVSLDRDGTGVTLTHILTNKGTWPVELAPWALTIVKGGGQTILPQEPFISHDDKLLPARSLTLWGFTDMSDPRWTFGRKYIRLKTDSKISGNPQKIGAANKQGWAGYLRDKTLFIKRFPYVECASYPDYGCNFETYTDGDFMEVETLGPLTKLDPGESATHVEHWYLFKDVDAGMTEDSLDNAIAPLVAKTAVR